MRTYSARILGVSPVTDLSELERSAYLNRPMPDGLSFPEQQLFLALRNLYKSASDGIIDQTTGAREKSSLLTAYNVMVFRESCGDRWVKLIKQSEQAVTDYRKSPSMETADILVDTIEGRLHCD